MAQLRRRFRFPSGEGRRADRGPQDAPAATPPAAEPERTPVTTPAATAEPTAQSGTPEIPTAATTEESAPTTEPTEPPEPPEPPEPTQPDATDTPAQTRPKRARRTRGRTTAQASDAPAEKADRGELLRQAIGVLAAAHLPLGVLVGAGVGAGVALTGRPADEAAFAGLAVLVVLAATGLGNDVADVERDRETQARGKPVASDLLPAGNAAFVAVCLAVVAVPLALRHGTVAGAALLACLPVGWLYNRWLRRTALSPLPWILTSALLLTFVAYGGPGWGVWGAPPTWEMTAAAAALAVGVHFLTSLPDLVGDNRTGVRHLPLRIALRIGAPRLLLLSGLVTAAAVVAVVLVALGPGLRQA